MSEPIIARLPRYAAGGVALAAALALFAPASRGETGWIKDEVRLNLRTGPGVQYRILGGVKTGDSVEILSRGDGWTEVRAPGHPPGWIPEGYLQPGPPAQVRLARRDAEAGDLEQRVAGLSEEAAQLRQTNQLIAARDRQQKGEIERLTRENLELRAGARWPEWITGAGIISVGMIVGALLHRNATRRPGPRIRL